MKVRNILLTVIAGLFLTGPLMLALATGALKMSLPSWLTAEDASFFDGGVTQTDIQGSLSFEGIASKDLQQQLEETIENSIPCKALAMLGNAQVQRWAIQLGNIPFQWDCYPTFLGSEKIFIPRANALAYTPWKQSEEADQKLRSFADGVVNVAKAHPEKRFVIYLPGGLHEGAINPANDYVSNSFTLEHAKQVLQEKAQGQSNVHVMADQYTNLEDYYQNFWRTDHHWNPLGCARAYNAIAEQMGLDPFTEEKTVNIPIQSFMGRTSPSALYMVEEPAFDLDYDFSCLTMTSYDGTQTFDGNDHSLFWSMNETLRKYEFNAAWLLSQETSRIDGPGTGRALMVSDSFGAGLQRLLALQYATLDLPWDLFWYESGDSRLVDYLTEDTQDIYLVADYSDFSGLLERFPHYFDLE